MDPADQQIPAGSPAFFSALLAHIEDATHGQSLPVDPVVLKSILLCFIAGDKHLLLRTPVEDVPLIMRIVATILSSLFCLVTHKLRIRRRESKATFEQANTSAFLRSIFLPGVSTASLDQVIHQSEKRRSGSRSTKRKSRPFSRSLSFPNDHSVVSAPNPFDEKANVVSNPVASRHAVSPVLPHSHSDPTPLYKATEPTRQGPVPHAIVISGLENASLPSQRALTQVLLDKRLVFDSQERGRPPTVDVYLDRVWILPNDFFLVYICPLDPRERPAIHKTLLDQFAMSAAVHLTPDIRALAKHPHSTHLPAPVIPPTYLPCLRRYYERTHFPVRLSLYLADLFSATRHHQELDGTFLTARALSDAQDLARAARVLGGDPTGMQLIQDTARFKDNLSIETRETGYTSEGNKIIDVMNGISEGSVDVHVSVPCVDNEPEVLDVSEADIARIAPRVMSHRLRVRDSDDGIFHVVKTGAAMPPPKLAERTTVKDVLVQILAEECKQALHPRGRRTPLLRSPLSTPLQSSTNAAQEPSTTLVYTNLYDNMHGEDLPTHPTSMEWKYYGHRGILVFGTEALNELSFRLLSCDQEGVWSVLWSWKLPEGKFAYHVDGLPSFHWFQGLTRKYGILFEDDGDADAFLRVVWEHTSRPESPQGQLDVRGLHGRSFMSASVLSLSLNGSSETSHRPSTLAKRSVSKFWSLWKGSRKS